MEELRSYAEALLAWIYGKPIQYLLHKDCAWLDWPGPPSSNNYPSFYGEMWRVKPGKEYWYRNFLGSDGNVYTANASHKHLLENNDMKWVDDPRSVWVDK